jgi:hypothetical protein
MQKTPCSIVIDLCYSPSLDGKRRQRGIAAPFGVPQGSTDQRAAIREGMTARLPLTCQGSTHQLAANREGMANRRAPTPRRTSLAGDARPQLQADRVWSPRSRSGLRSAC